MPMLDPETDTSSVIAIDLYPKYFALSIISSGLDPPFKNEKLLRQINSEYSIFLPEFSMEIPVFLRR